MEAGISAEPCEFIGPHPPLGLGLVVGVDCCTLRRKDHEPHVVVVVCVLGRRVDTVDVEIDRDGPHPQAVDAGLFLSLSQCNGWEVRITVGMAAGLDPDLQLRMEQNESALKVGVHDQRRAGEVPGSLDPVERTRASIDEFAHSAARNGEIGSSHRVDRCPRQFRVAGRAKLGSFGGE